MLNDQLTRTLHEEMKVCCDAACRYPSNYNAWSHRIWVLQHMARGNIKVCSRGVFETNVAFCDGSTRVFIFSFQFFHDELSSVRLWVSMHVSDHSGFHYRQFLLKELMTELSQAPTSSHASQGRSSTAPSSSPPHPSHTEANGELTGAEASGDEERQLNSATVLQLFHQELELCSDLIQSFPGHETLWSHR